MKRSEIRECLERALKAARAATDLTPGSRCAVGDEHKKAFALYLGSWVIGPLEEAIWLFDDSAPKGRKVRP